MSEIKYSKEYIKYQISELENRHGDIEEIKRLKRILAGLERNQERMQENPNKKFREQVKRQAQSNNVNKGNAPKRAKTDEIRNNSSKRTKTIKNKPSLSFKRASFYGLIAGVVLGIPAYKTTYNYTSNLPVSTNYITVGESKRGITERKDHDNSKYRRYLIEGRGFTEEEADKRIAREEETGRWER